MKVMAAFAVHIAMHILAMVASAISFLIVKIAQAISLTGMAFFSQAITLLQTIVVALGAGLGVWGVINLLEGYGNDNPGAKSQGIKLLRSTRSFSSRRTCRWKWETADIRMAPRSI